MSIFGKIKDAIFGKKVAPVQEPGMRQSNPSSPVGGGDVTIAPAPTTQPDTQVNVEQVLAGIAASKGNPDLNWRTSIVDLMKLLDMDSSLQNRKELATELGYTGEKDGSAEMNMWLQKEVMRQLAAHGGKIPANLTD
ncbi:DUF3597 domain-containing protein [Sphingomonas lutea]|uniref:DUF3597 domain-containing protein n=1 Tax=Sphingomonas lutea TaxID=1045317 RepID=A0A7G9SJ71_9SPHN|nr:DUF3597 domain-containing protein [Sphingomonas lutea]QNN67896.1 DUF3597 domain-containing protein [Sphingomonas lutea]